MIFEQDLPNSAFNQRPVMLQMGKESTTQLQAQALFNQDMKMMRERGINMAEGVNVKVFVVATSVDRKASNLYLGTGGSYCDLCMSSKDSCQSVHRVESGFVIDRDVESMN